MSNSKLLNQIFGNYLVTVSQENMDYIIEKLIDIGTPRQRARAVITAEYCECLSVLRGHYSTLSAALSDVYQNVVQHETFPREGARPMTQRDARNYERDIGEGGIATGFNKFQSWANNILNIFDVTRILARDNAYLLNRRFH